MCVLCGILFLNGWKRQFSGQRSSIISRICVLGDIVRDGHIAAWFDNDLVFIKQAAILSGSTAACMKREANVGLNAGVNSIRQYRRLYENVWWPLELTAPASVQFPVVISGYFGLCPDFRFTDNFIKSMNFFVRNIMTFQTQSVQ